MYRKIIYKYKYKYKVINIMYKKYYKELELKRFQKWFDKANNFIYSNLTIGFMRSEGISVYVTSQIVVFDRSAAIVTMKGTLYNYMIMKL